MGAGELEAPLTQRDPVSCCPSSDRSPSSCSSRVDLPVSLRPNATWSLCFTDAAGLLRHGFLPREPERRESEGEPDDEGDRGGQPRAAAGPVDEDPDCACEQGGAHEPFAADELLRRLPAGHVDVVATGGRSYDSEEEAADEGEADADAFLRADDRVPGQ
jgi:hypothetical protein